MTLDNCIITIVLTRPNIVGGFWTPICISRSQMNRLRRRWGQADEQRRYTVTSRRSIELVYMPVLRSSSSGPSVRTGVRRSMISDGCFDNGLRRAEVATGYEHVAGHTTYLAGLGLSSGINEWPRSLVRKLRRPIIAAGR